MPGGGFKRRRKQSFRRPAKRSKTVVGYGGRTGLTMMSKVNRRTTRRRPNKKWKQFKLRVNKALKQEPKFTNWAVDNKKNLANNLWRCISFYNTTNVKFPSPQSSTNPSWSTDHASFAGNQYECIGFNVILRFFPGPTEGVDNPRDDLLTNTRLDMLILSQKKKSGEVTSIGDDASITTGVFKQEAANSVAGPNTDLYFSDLDTGRYRNGIYCHKRLVLRAPNKDMLQGTGTKQALEYHF